MHIHVTSINCLPPHLHLPVPLQHVLSDQQSGLKGLGLARKHSLTAASYNLARRLAAHARHTGQLASTLHWALQAHDAQLCAELVAPLIADIQQQLLAQVRLQPIPLTDQAT